MGLNFKQNSLKGRIYSWLPRKWTSSYRVEEFAQKLGYQFSVGSRKARELAEKGFILRRQVQVYTYHNNKRKKTIIAEYRRK